MKNEKVDYTGVYIVKIDKLEKEIERLNRVLLNIKDELNFARDLIVTSNKIIIGNIPTFIRIEKEVDKAIGSDKE